MAPLYDVTAVVKTEEGEVAVRRQGRDIRATNAARAVVALTKPKPAGRGVKAKAAFTVLTGDVATFTVERVE